SRASSRASSGAAGHQRSPGHGSGTHAHAHAHCPVGPPAVSRRGHSRGLRAGGFWEIGGFSGGREREEAHGRDRRERTAAKHVPHGILTHTHTHTHTHRHR